MVKYLRILLPAILILFLTHSVSAQYAIGGTAGNDLVKSVYWLTWNKDDPNKTLVSWPDGATEYGIENGTYIWQFSPTVRITGVVSNLTFGGGTAAVLQAYTPGPYPGTGLDLLYSGNNLPKPDSRGVPNSALAVDGGFATFDLTATVELYSNNVWVPINYLGMVVADGESIDHNAGFVDGESISAHTPSVTFPWHLLNKRTDGNTGDDSYKLDLSNSGADFKLYVDQPPGNLGVQGVMFAQGINSLTNIKLVGSGTTAAAFGLILPFDQGDAPASYGVAGHYIDGFQVSNPMGAVTDGTFTVTGYSTTTLTSQASVYIGANNVDADGLLGADTSTTATVDDNIGANDENTLTPATLPGIKVNQTGDVTINLPVTNTKSTAATLYGWIDFNGDGVFTPDELAIANVPGNTPNANFTLTYPNASFTGKLKAGPIYARFRVTTSPLIDDPSTPVDEKSIGFAGDGEVEDYKFKDIIGVTISGSVVDDGNGTTDAQISGTGTQSVSGHQLYAYLVDNTGTIVNKTTVNADGTYSLPNANSGTYTVAISTNSVGLGGNISTVVANLPANWQASGAAYGTNNLAGTGLQTGVPNLQIPVTTPGASLDVTLVNFGINQAPVTVADVDTTSVGQPITIAVTGNDTDADGTVNSSTVLLIDPADNVKKATVTIPLQGTYTVDGTGQVIFTPLATFTGNATPIAYTVKDNFGTESASALISVTVRPAGTGDVGVTVVDVPVTTAVIANDGPSAVGATVTPANGTHGTTTTDGAGNVIYTPASGYMGTDVYTYTLTQNGITSSPIAVNITVNPIGTPDSAKTTVNTPVITTVTTNDGVSGVGSTVIAINGAHGTTSVSGGNVTYTLALDYVGTDTYTYTLTNNGVTSAPVTVNVIVLPVGTNDAVTTPVNTPVTTAVTANDGSSASSATIAVTNGTHGTTTTDGVGNVTYTPAADYIGTDTYTYTLTKNGVTSAPITVNVTVLPVGVNDAVTTPINTPVTTPVTANDGASATGATVVATNGAHGITTVSGGNVTYTPATDYIGTDTYTYTLTNNGITSAPITVTVTVIPAGIADAVTTPVNTAVTTSVTANDGASGVSAILAATNGVHGTTTINGGNVTYTPAAGYIGTDTYTYNLTNNGVTSAPITVTVTVISVGIPDATTTPVNTVVTTAVTANDGISGTGATVTATNGAHGITTVSGSNVTYTPASGYIGTDTYTYTLTNNGITSAPITVTVTVIPVGAADASTTPINTPVTTAVTANDGASGTGATVTATNGAHGTTTVNGGNVTYTPASGYIGTDTYTYTLINNGVTSAPITVTVTVTPGGTADVASTPINTPVTTAVTANDGASGSGATVAATNGAHGTTTVNGGNVTYTPATGYVGIDTYTYTLTNNGVTSAPIMVTVTVLPVGTADAGTTPINTPVTTAVSANDGASGTGATVTAINGAHGTTSVNAGNVTYTPATGYIGVDTYTYTLTNNGVTSAPITVTITVMPVGVPDNAVTLVGTPVTTNVTANDGASGVGATVIATNGTRGTTTVSGGNVTYTPIAGFTGTDTYTYTLTSNGVTSAPITVTVNVRSPLSASNDAATTNANVPVVIDILANDNAGVVPLDPASVVIVQQPQHGTVHIDPATGKVTYTPATNYYGPDVFTYTVKDKNGNISNAATVNITVNDVPVIGLAKAAVSAVKTLTGTFDVTYVLTVGNYGVSDLSNISIKDDLTRTFQGQTITVKSIKALGALKVNSSYDGTANTDMLQAGNVLTRNALEQIQVVVNVSLTAGSNNYLNTATAQGTSTSGLVATDQSTDGLRPDPNTPGDVSPAVPTPIELTKPKEFIPGGFSPNGDGVNDKFVIENTGTERIDLEIYNRWGNRVYRSSDYKNTWDGKCTEGFHIGDDVPVGTYYYIVKFDGTDRRVGYITISR